MGNLMEYSRPFQEGLSGMGLAFEPKTVEMLLTFAESVLVENQLQNLTRITEPSAVISRHLLDSLAILQWVKPFSGCLCDVGSGGGFPGIPLAIALPETMVTLIDSEGKKVAFLQRVSQELGLANITAVHARAEDAGQDLRLRETFDLVVSRSVANFAVLCEYTLPLVSEGASFWAYKGDNGRQEAAQASGALSALGGEVSAIFDYQLPTGETHTAIKVSKIRKTPRQYPRRPGVPAKRPLS